MGLSSGRVIVLLIIETKKPVDPQHAQVQKGEQFSSSQLSELGLCSVFTWIISVQLFAGVSEQVMHDMITTYTLKKILKNFTVAIYEKNAYRIINFFQP